MSDPPPKIAISGLRKSFGPKLVLDGVEIECGAGESLVIIGGSGTGKSVLIKCIIGLVRPDAGSIRIDGAEGIVEIVAPALRAGEAGAVGAHTR